jgi:hypothetical protein
MRQWISMRRIGFMGTRLLIDEEPLQVLPSLAARIGLNEAIVLQQIHYWLKKSEHTMEGQRWIYNTYGQWRAQFPFWGLNTIKRTVWRLEKLGVLTTTARFNRNPIDKTRWYTINYDRLQDFCAPTTAQDGPSTAQDGSTTAQDGSTTAQIGSLDSPIWVARQPNLGRVPESTPENTAEISENPSPPSGDLPAPKKLRGGQPKREYSPGFQQFIDAYPRGRVTSKPTCYATWTKHDLEPRTAELIEKIERLKITNWQDEYPRYVPYSIKWFKEQRWEDDLVPLPSALERLRGNERRTADVTLRILQEGETRGRPRHARVLHRA